MMFVVMNYKSLININIRGHLLLGECGLDFCEQWTEMVQNGLGIVGGFLSLA